MGAPQKRGLKYEEYKARKMGYKHLGGPGRVDAKRGREKVEIKKWKTKVGSGVIKAAIKKGVTTIVAPGGFTGPAKELARKKGVRIRRH